MIIKKTINIHGILFLAAVVGSLLSQTPQMLESGTGRILQLLWLFPAASLLLTTPTSFLNKKLTIFYITAFFFASYCVLLDSLSSSSYIGNDLRNISISVMMTCVSFAFWKHNASNGFLKLFCFTLLITGSFLAILIYKDFLAGYDIMLKTYAFENKNSMGQILFCCFLIPILCLKTNNKIIKLFVWACISVMGFVTLLLKSRATLAGIFFVIAYFVFKSKNKQIKRITILLVVLTIIILIAIPELYDILVNGILLAGRDANDLNDLSSGRVALVSNVLQQIPDHIFFGLGNFYLDNMPIAFFGQYGLLGSSVVFIFLISLTIKILRLDRNNDINLTVFLFWAAFIINSLFEAYPPFGPGVKCFLLWITLGFALAQQTTINKQKQ